MKILIDTNILLPAEPTCSSDYEPNEKQIIEFVNLSQKAKHQLLIHPCIYNEISNDKDYNRKQKRLLLINKYNYLPSPPDITNEIQNIIGISSKGTHGYYDDLLLSAVYYDSVDYLVTEDKDIHKKSIKLNIEERVTYVEDILIAIKSLYYQKPTPPPNVLSIFADELNIRESIFDSFYSDYPNFEKWIYKCQRKKRNAWLIKNNDATYAGLCIVKEKNTSKFGLCGHLLKICSFKVDNSAFGKGYGELLLKVVFQYAFKVKFDYLYLTVYPKYQGLIRLLKDFGFYKSNQTTELNEEIYIKRISYNTNEYNQLAPHEFNIIYGPFQIKYEETVSYIVPIQPKYHKILFPTQEKQISLFHNVTASGNAIRKAYLCHSNIKMIKPGAIIFFYRSEDQRSISYIGVVDKTLRSKVSNKIARFVGTRTVYSFDEIKFLCNKNVLAILFRHAKTISNPISYDELYSNGIINAPPQSIVRIKQERLEWLKKRIEK